MVQGRPEAVARAVVTDREPSGSREFSEAIGKDGTLTGKASTATGEMTRTTKRDMK